MTADRRAEAQREWSMTKITADGTTLMKQATMTAHDYLLKAVRDIDEVLGDHDSAINHPALIAAYMQIAATDLGTAVIAQQIRAGLEAIASAISTKT
jgi:hypothetical protein